MYTKNITGLFGFLHYPSLANDINSTKQTFTSSFSFTLQFITHFENICYKKIYQLYERVAR